MKAKPVRRERVMSEINIAPFTDVVLVLLVIFMITTPLIMQPEIKVDLPAAKSAQSEVHKTVTVLLDPRGYIFIDEKKVESKDLADNIALKLKEDPEIPVVLKADRKVVYDNVVNAIDACKQGGARKFALAVELKKKTDSAGLQMVEG